MTGITVDQQIFGVANASNQTAVGILGIGPSKGGFNASYPYALMLSNMVAQGHIQSAAFSLDLRDFDNATGSLIFGGIDKAKYSGPLQQIPFETIDFQVQGQTVKDIR